MKEMKNFQDYEKTQKGEKKRELIVSPRHFSDFESYLRLDFKSRVSTKFHHPGSNENKSVKSYSAITITSVQRKVFEARCLHKKGRQHERNGRQQFDQHVQTGTRSIFKRIT